MKHLLLFAFLCVTFQAFSQDCEFKASTPDELYRGRYREGIIYGNPYTMFNRNRANWSLQEDTQNIVQHIFAGQPLLHHKEIDDLIKFTHILKIQSSFLFTTI